MLPTTTLLSEHRDAGNHKIGFPIMLYFAKHLLKASRYQTKMPNTSHSSVQSHFYWLTPTEQVNLLHTSTAAGRELNTKKEVQ
jgi:hypothetical protein